MRLASNLCILQYLHLLEYLLRSVPSMFGEMPYKQAPVVAACRDEVIATGPSNIRHMAGVSLIGEILRLLRNDRVAKQLHQTVVIRRGEQLQVGAAVYRVDVREVAAGRPYSLHRPAQLAGLSLPHLDLKRVAAVIIAVINAQHVVIVVLYTYAVRYNVTCTYESMYLCYKGWE